MAQQSTQTDILDDGAGFLMLLPWVAVQKAVTLAGFKFVPVDANDPTPAFGERLGETVRLILSRHIDVLGEKVPKCTAVFRKQGPRTWDVGDVRSEAWSAAGLLALVALSEQRFFEGAMSPHLNAAIFRPIMQGIVPGSDRIALYIPRRGGASNVGGLRFSDVTFQMPLEAYHTECPALNSRLVEALNQAKHDGSDAFRRLSSSLPFFLLAHAETAE